MTFSHFNPIKRCAGCREEMRAPGRRVDAHSPSSGWPLLSSWPVMVAMVVAGVKGVDSRHILKGRWTDSLVTCTWQEEGLVLNGLMPPSSCSWSASTCDPCVLPRREVLLLSRTNHQGVCLLSPHTTGNLSWQSPEKGWNGTPGFPASPPSMHCYSFSSLGFPSSSRGGGGSLFSTADPSFPSPHAHRQPFLQSPLQRSPRSVV